MRKEKAMRYWFHRCLAPCFVAWCDYTEGSLRVKGMFLKQMMGIKRRLFERWYAFVEWTKKRRFAHFLARNLADRACEETLEMIVDWYVVAPALQSSLAPPSIRVCVFSEPAMPTCMVFCISCVLSPCFPPL